MSEEIPTPVASSLQTDIIVPEISLEEVSTPRAEELVAEVEAEVIAEPVTEVITEVVAEVGITEISRRPLEIHEIEEILKRPLQKHEIEEILRSR